MGIETIYGRKPGSFRARHARHAWASTTATADLFRANWKPAAAVNNDAPHATHLHGVATPGALSFLSSCSSIRNWGVAFRRDGQWIWRRAPWMRSAASPTSSPATAGKRTADRRPAEAGRRIANSSMPHPAPLPACGNGQLMASLRQRCTATALRLIDTATAHRGDRYGWDPKLYAHHTLQPLQLLCDGGMQRRRIEGRTGGTPGGAGRGRYSRTSLDCVPLEDAPQLGQRLDLAVPHPLARSATGGRQFLAASPSRSRSAVAVLDHLAAACR